jgi:carbamoyltransferase
MIEINTAYLLVSILAMYLTLTELRSILKKIFILITTPIWRCLGYRKYKSKEYLKIQRELKTRVENGETVYIIGITLGTHNAGASLVCISMKDGVTLVCNNEEERFSGTKHDWRFPCNSLSKLKEIIVDINTQSGKEAKILCCLVSWDFMSFSATWFDYLVSNFPYNYRLWLPSKSLKSFIDMDAILHGPKLLFKDPFFSKNIIHNNKFLGSRHHDNHAYMSYGISPFFNTEASTMVLVVDGMGDDASISFYVSSAAVDNSKKLIFIGSNDSIFDSIGILYQVISSSQGGWTPLSSEGRYMGASAWGNLNRQTNDYYLQLRQIVEFGDNGDIKLNKKYVNWHIDPSNNPYKRNLISILGMPILPSECWNPDNVLNVDDVQHAPATLERCDKAAALQMVFEDCIFHLVAYLISKSKKMFGHSSNQLIWTGGCALNCATSMHLLDQFNQDFYKRADTSNKHGNKNVKNRTLHLWVPPFPSDPGVAAGAVYAMVMQANIKKLQIHPLRHAFYCGLPYNSDAIQRSIDDFNDLGCIKISCDANESKKNIVHVADFLAFAVGTKNMVLGELKPLLQQIILLRLHSNKFLQVFSKAKQRQVHGHWGIGQLLPIQPIRIH